MITCHKCGAKYKVFCGECYPNYRLDDTIGNAALYKIMAMCGNPDAAQACRDIIAYCKELIGQEA